MGFIEGQLILAFIEKDRDCNIDDCIHFGGDYTVPVEMVENNSKLFRECNYDFPEFIRRIQAIGLKDRFNEERILAHASPDDPDYDLILSMSKALLC